MREIQEIPSLTAKKLRISIASGLALCLLAGGLGLGCSAKRTVTVAVSPKIAAAQNATLEQLLAIIGQYDRIVDLKCSSLKAYLTIGKYESGRQDEFKGASGYILLRRPDALHLMLLSPFIDKTSIFDLVSQGDDFSAWLRKGNKIYKGRNSARELVAEDLENGIPLRPAHVFEAILPSGIPMQAPHQRISVEEAADKIAKYYILSVYRDGVAPRIHTLRRIWIERSRLELARQQMYGEDGRLICEVEYPVMERIGDFVLPIRMHLNRPEEGYSLELEFKSTGWKINTGVEDAAFVLTPRAGAENIYLKEKR